ncbi:hypothetical protein ACWCYY_40110 [Kitasatospora sp. NPDC001664]
MSESLTAPRTTWEFCLAAADGLVQGHAPADLEQHKRVVLLIAAVTAAAADAGGQSEAGIGDVLLDGQPGVLDLLLVGGRPCVRAFPGGPGQGAEQTEYLLASDERTFAEVRFLAEGVLRAHLAASPHAVPTVRAALTRAAHARQLADIGEALGMSVED